MIGELVNRWATLLLSTSVGHLLETAAGTALLAAMKYITGRVSRKRSAPHPKEKFLQLLNHSAMELNQETADAFRSGNIFPGLPNSFRGMPRVIRVRT
jgi:hypothetical protein